MLDPPDLRAALRSGPVTRRGRGSMGPVTSSPSRRLRTATVDDADQLLSLWGLLFEPKSGESPDPWTTHAREWFEAAVDDEASAWFPVVEVDGRLVACAVGTLELGVPNPYCVRGRTVRLANVVTLPEHRGQGYGTRLTRDVVEWARRIGADRVDLSATPEGQRVYERAGFTATSAPRLKLVL